MCSLDVRSPRGGFRSSCRRRWRRWRHSARTCRTTARGRCMHWASAGTTELAGIRSDRAYKRSGRRISFHTVSRVTKCCRLNRAEPRAPILASSNYMDIQITTKKSEGVERLLEVSVPLVAVRDEEEKTAKRYAASVRLPGFRPGKAPAAMVRKRFKDAIRQQVLETLV